MISPERIIEKLNNPSFYRISCVEQVDSTNRVVKEWAQQGLPEGRVLIAFSQTQGRGRMGRQFYSPQGTGVYFSLLLRPRCSAEQITLLTPLTAVAVAKAMEKYGKSPMIKWVNDIFVDHRKVCGILAESGYPDYVVMGVGINLAPPEHGFPEDLQSVAGAVFDAMPSQEQLSHFMADILNGLEELYHSLQPHSLLAYYRNHNWLKGKTVTAGGITGRVADIGEDFSLCLQDIQGNFHHISTGEATIGSKNSL